MLDLDRPAVGVAPRSSSCRRAESTLLTDQYTTGKAVATARMMAARGATEVTVERRTTRVSEDAEEINSQADEAP